MRVQISIKMEYVSIETALKYIEKTSGPYDYNSFDAYAIEFTDEDQKIFNEVQSIMSYNSDDDNVDNYYSHFAPDGSWDRMLRYAGKKSSNIKKAIELMTGDSECGTDECNYMKKLQARRKRAIAKYEKEKKEDEDEFYTY
jgi:hypothetical protein